MINFIKFWKVGNIFSLILIIISIFSCITKPFNLGIDFTGGVLIEIHSDKNIDPKQIESINSEFEKKQIKNIIQNNGPQGLIIKLQADNKNQKDIIEQTKTILDSKFDKNKLTYDKIDFIGAQISKEFFFKSSMAILIALVGIMIYLIVRFDWRFALGGIIGLIHDVIITFGLISIFSVEFNMISVTAILTVIGYSINDSVIIYDRIREIMKIHKDKPIRENINLSLNNTLTRTIFTSVTTLLAAGVLMIFGGKALESFSIVVFFGILIGTYSSIFVASQFIDLITKK